MARFGLGVALAAGLAALVAGEAVAADLSYPVKAPVEEPLSPWMIRVRALYVMPEDGGWVNGVAGSDLTYSDAVVPELDISYFFTKNIAAELILGVTPHDINGAGTIANLGQVASTWLLPPTLTLQYHFTDFGAFKPYVGAGINYTVFFDTSIKNPAITNLQLKGSWGWALQAGFDWMIDRHWGFNVDVKKIFNQPDFNISVAGTPLTGTAQLDPWIFGTGVTYRF